jgi:hypothetical protein
MTARCVSSTLDLANEDRVGRKGTSGAVAACTHPHMPRRRKSASPFLEARLNPSPSSPLKKRRKGIDAATGDG